MSDNPFPIALLVVHFTGGMLSLLAGAAAMANPKGSRRHGAWGTLFFIGMMTLTSTGVYMATVIRPHMGNFMGSALPLYLTATAWLTVRRPPAQVGRLEFAALGWGVMIVAAGVLFARAAADQPRGTLDGFPARYYLIVATLTFLGVAFDVRMLLRGGVAGVARTTRHLIRMCGALLILTTAFFSGRARDFPLAVRQTGVLKIPIFLMLGLFLYWIFRVRVLPAVRRYRWKGGTVGQWTAG